MESDTLTIVLAGGKGTRLEPLTHERAKPAVPFGAIHRIIDFPLSNCVNGGLRRALVLTQYKAGSLIRHLDLAWRFLSREMNEFVQVAPPQQRLREQWYQGTADAIYQNIYTIEREKSSITLILAGDHVYRMDYREMIAFHRARGAELTIGCLPVPLAEAGSFGVMRADDDGRVTGFAEKPREPEPMPGSETHALASMGIYVFNSQTLFEIVCEDAANHSASRRDFGSDVIPRMIDARRVFAFPHERQPDGSPAYWRDVGTLAAYYAAQMDLVSPTPALDLGSENWPIRTFAPHLPPASIRWAGETDPEWRGHGLLAGPGVRVEGACARGSVLSARARIEAGAVVEGSVLFEGVVVGRGARVRRAIVDRGVTIPPGCRIGFDHELDADRGFTVTPEGLTVIPKDTEILE